MLQDALEDTPASNAQFDIAHRQLKEDSAPQPLNPAHPENPVINEKKAMENLFSSLEERGVMQPKKLSEFELFSRLEFYRNQTKNR